MSADKGISAFPDGDTLLTWVATVTGPDDSVYEGITFYSCLWPWFIIDLRAAWNY